ncbi:MAG: hypothetical protein ACTHPS_03540 [Streptosporangiaceae bacterium]
MTLVMVVGVGIRGPLLHETLLLHRHPAARSGREGLHLLGDPGRGGADATVRVGLAGQGVPGAETNQLLDSGLDPGRVYPADQCPQGRVEHLR